MRTALLCLLLLILAPAAHAEDVTASHREAADQLLVLLDAKNTMMGGAEELAMGMVQQNPALEPYWDILLNWATRVMTWENFEAEFQEMYVETYSEAELRELIAFYQTPTGQKSVRVAPDLMERGAIIGNDVASRHADSLRAMIEERATGVESMQKPDSQ